MCKSCGAVYNNSDHFLLDVLLLRTGDSHQMIQRLDVGVVVAALTPAVRRAGKLLTLPVARE